MSVLLLERDAVVGRAVRRWCNESSPLRVSAVAREVPEVLQLAGKLKPRVVLVDLAVVGMPDAEDTLFALREASPNARIVAFSGPEFRMPAFDLPVDDFVARPYGLRSMAEDEVVRAVGGRLRHAFHGVTPVVAATA